MNELSPIWATLLVLSPALAAGVILVARLTTRWAARTGAVASAVSVALAAGLLSRGPQDAVVAWSWAPELFVEVSWRLTTAPLALAVLVAGIGCLILQYTGVYLGSSADGSRTLALLALFETAMLGLVLTDNLFLLYIFWELTGICSFFLISSDRSKGAAGLRAAGQALMVTVAGGLPLLIAMVYLVSTTGTASLAELLTLELGLAVQTTALALILPAVMTKSAQVPTHFWLPGAMAAPTPISAYLHSATMVKAGIVLLLYLYPALGGSPLWTWSLLPIGAATCLWGSWRALCESDIKLLMAWSTVSQLGLLTLTIGLGTDVAIRAAILHLFAHAIFKAGLFLVVGLVDHSARTRSLFELGGLRRRAPLLAVVAAILAGSMAGIPPLAGFLSKELILKKAMLADFWVHALAISAIVLGSIGTVAYSSRFFFEIFSGAPRSRQAETAQPPPYSMVVAPAILTVLTLLAGPLARWVDLWFLEPVAMAVTRTTLEVKPLSLWYGINVALVLSLVIATVGYLTDRALGLRFLGARRSRWPNGPEIFDRLLESSQRLGSAVVRILTGATPRTYLALAVVCGLLPALALVRGLPGAFQPGAFQGGTSPASLALIAVMAVLLAALLRSNGGLTRVLLLTAVGFAVAMLFRLMNGPDLMLTQLLVEILLTIFFALALRALPRRVRRHDVGAPDPFRAGRVLLAGGAALAAAALVPAVMQAPRSDHVVSYAREVAPDVAKGANMVNVVLTDLRSLDTLMETLVVVLGTLGAVGLLRRFECADRLQSRGARGPSAPRHGLLPGMARVILPISIPFALILLIKGHNDPGGGFVAGLSLGVTAMLALVAFGPEAVCRRMPISFSGVAILGILTMVGGGLIGLFTGQSFLTQFHGKLQLFGSSVAWHTTLIFDIGVMLAVAGSLGAVELALWSDPATQRRKEKPRTEEAHEMETQEMPR